MELTEYKASRAVEVRTNIRFAKVLTYQDLAKIFHGDISDIEPYTIYLYAFFEECYPTLIKKFMVEQNISREQIIDVFNRLPEVPDKAIFREALATGKL